MRAPVPSDDRSRLILPLLGWLAGAVFFFYAWVLRVAPSVMVVELMRDFSVGAAVLGHLSAAYFYGYAGMQIPVGILLDRFGPRRLMTVAAFVCAGGCVLFATGETLAAATAGRILIGASAAFSLVGAMAVAGQWFSPSRFALLSGLAMAAGMAGGVFGQAPLRLVVGASTGARPPRRWPRQVWCSAWPSGPPCATSGGARAVSAMYYPVSVSCCAIGRLG
jgi:MFS family permease